MHHSIHLPTLLGHCRLSSLIALGMLSVISAAVVTVEGIREIRFRHTRELLNNRSTLHQLVPHGVPCCIVARLILGVEARSPWCTERSV
jgi:hypothetical protein